MVNRFHILLVNPACQDKRVTDDDARVVPIGLYYIAAQLKAKGFDTTILNLADSGAETNAETDPLAVFSKALKALSPDLVGFSVTNPSRMNAIQCANHLKERFPDLPVVFGGPCPTFLYQQLFESCPGLDIIIPGEGERSFLNLAMHVAHQGLNHLEQIPGLIFKDKDQIIQTDTQPPIEDLDTLVHPARYFTFNHLSMSRGCPGKCTFCGSPRFWSDPHVRFHSAQWMFDEIKLLVEKGIHRFFISDDTFTMDRERVIHLCRLIVRDALPITWNAISRADYIDDDLLLAMRKAGCIQISFGVESGSPDIRKTLGKPIDQKTIIRAFERTLAHGILPRAYFIYGSPGETNATIQQSIDLMHRITPLSAVFYLLVIFPGTHLYQLAKNRRQVDDTIWQTPIEDLPWFEVDDHLDFPMVKAWGDRLRSAFHEHISQFATSVQLADIPDLYPFHADFLSRLAMTFSHGEYATHPQVNNAETTAMILYEKALSFSPDARAYMGLGMLYQKKKDFQKAVGYIQQGLDHFNHHVDLNLCMGLCLMNMKRFEKALPYFTKIKAHASVDHYIRICRDHIKQD